MDACAEGHCQSGPTVTSSAENQCCLAETALMHSREGTYVTLSCAHTHHELTSLTEERRSRHIDAPAGEEA